MVKLKRNFRFKDIITGHILENLKEYTLVTILFIIGVIIGVIFINNISNNQMNEINTYINSFIDVAKNGTSINSLELLKNSIIQNTILAIILWFVGSTLIGLPIVYGIVAFRGFCLGYTISVVISILGSAKGMIFVSTAMLLQNVIFIPCVFALAVSGTRLYKAIMKDKRKENIKLAIIKHTMFSLLICIILVISSFVEVYISTNIFYACLRFI